MERNKQISQGDTSRQHAFGKQSDDGSLFPVRVSRIVQAARRIRAYELRTLAGGELPAFNAGSHVQVKTPSGILRSYSLCNHPGEQDRYVIAVQREAEGEGGSISVYDTISEGDSLLIGAPTNNFELTTAASRYLLIAGGIGITPILAMARWLAEHDADFRVLYCARDRTEAAFVDELYNLDDDGRVIVHYDGGDPGRAFDLDSLLANHEAGTHAYCCGPVGMLRAVQAATSHWPKGTAHFEDFGNNANTKGTDRTFTLTVEDTNEEFMVPSDRSILEVLRENGYEVPSSCESGSCGTCMMRLVEGDCDHRDFVLDEQERERFIMVCVSRAVGRRITIGL